MTTQNSANCESQGRWASYLSNMSVARWKHAATSLGNNAYIACGMSSTTDASILNTFLKYDSTTDTYSSLANVSTSAVIAPTLVSDGFNFYLIGGSTTYQSSYTAQSYNIRYNIGYGLDSWTLTSGGSGYTAALTQMPYSTVYHAAAYAKGAIYVSGGFNGSSGIKSFYKYTISGTGPGSWTQLTDVPASSYIYYHASCASQDGNFIYVFGGYNSGSYSNVVYKYDVVNTKWVTPSPSIMPYYSSSEFNQPATIGKYSYLMQISRTYTCLKYDMENDKYDFLSESPLNNSSGSSAVANGAIYTFGGFNGSVQSAVSCYKL